MKKARFGSSLVPGCWLAVVLSYAINKSIWWCLLHFIMGWLYVVYWLFEYTAIDVWIGQWIV